MVKIIEQNKNKETKSIKDYLELRNLKKLIFGHELSFIFCPMIENNAEQRMHCFGCDYGHMLECHFPFRCRSPYCKHYIGYPEEEYQKISETHYWKFRNSLYNNSIFPEVFKTRPNKEEIDKSIEFIHENLTDAAKEKLGDIKYYSRKSPDHPKCAVCERIIDDDVPLRFFTPDANMEIAFHVKCCIKSEQSMPLLSIFNAVGVFVDKNKELILAHPENPKVKIISENNIQTDVIKNIKRIGLDLKGELIKDYFELLHLPNISDFSNTYDYFKLCVFGYAAIEPFFYAIRKDLDIFPNFFVFGITYSGKSTFLELLFNDLYGTKAKNVEDIETIARITKFSTCNTFPMNIDDIDTLNDEIINFIKTISTRKGYTKLSEQIYSSFTGSANNKQFIRGLKNKAFRERCLLFNLYGSIFQDDYHFVKFEQIRLLIKENRIVGFYLLEKAIEFIKKSYNKTSLTSYYKLIRLVKDTKSNLKFYLDIFNKISRKNQKFELEDVRRLTIYALIYIGWQFWDYCFKSKELESPLLKKALNLDNKFFFEFIKHLEKAGDIK